MNFGYISSIISTGWFLDYMPVQGSTFAREIDFMNNFITYVATFCTLAITGVMIYFTIKYRKRSDNDLTPNITHNATLETLWTVVPTIICAFVFYYGTMSYVDMRTPPANSIEIGVRGYQWAWEFSYPTGKKEGETLVVPVNRPVKLIMKSDDVNHSFYIPAMRVKEDVIGGTYHYLWFEPKLLGEFPIFCTEYCGKNHSGMMAKLKVVTQAEYDDHINDRTKGELPPEELGKAVWVNKGCKGCHSIDGSAVVGPTWKGLWGNKREFLDGGSATADENYIQESISNPNKHIVKGYQQGIMPMIPLTSEEVNTVIAFMKTLK
jgi:cytochrome c oxidase subunit 2